VNYELSPHAGVVRVLEQGPGGVLASGADDGTVALWDAEGRLLVSKDAPPRHDTAVHALAFADEGRALVSGGADRIARVWSALNGEKRCTMREHTDDVTAISAEPGPGHRVLSLDESNTAILWSAEDCATVHRFVDVVYAGFVRAEDGSTRIVTVRRGGRVEVASGDLSGRGQADAPQGSSVWGAFGAGAALLTGDDEGSVFAWKTDDPAAVPARLPADLHGAPAVTSAAGCVVAVAPDGVLRAWVGEAFTRDGGSYEKRQKDQYVRAAALTDDGERLFVIEEEAQGKLKGRVLGWGEWTGPGQVVTLDEGTGCDAAKGEDRVFAAVTMEAGPRILAVDAAGCVRVWDESGALRVEDRISAVVGDPMGRIVAAAIAPREERIVLASIDGAVSIWAPDQIGAYAFGPRAPGAAPARLRRLTLERRRHTGRVRAIAFHPSGGFAVTAGDDGQAWLWDVVDGHTLVRLGVHPGPVRWAAFRPDGDEVVTGGTGGWIRVWSTRAKVDDPQKVLDGLRAWLPEVLPGSAR
jgi:WD40 repeat protein